MKYFFTAFFLMVVFRSYSQVPPPAIKSIKKTDVTCNGFENGSITVVASNGRPPYRYSDNGGVTFQSGNVFNNLSAGTYTILIRDTLNQMSDSQQVQISEPAKLVLSCSGNIECADSSGLADVSVSGGTKPYLYSWTLPDGKVAGKTASMTGLSAGVYLATVTDSIGCKDTCSVTLMQQGTATPKYRVGDSISCGYVFYIDPNNDSLHPCATHYLVCSYKDQGTKVTWYNTESLYNITNATTDILFDRENANKIIDYSTAAKTASDFRTDSCSGWYLPSLSELALVYTNLAAKGIGGFAREGYWTSVEGTKRHCSWIVDFLNGRKIQNDKSNKYHVRAICDLWIKN